MEPRPLLRALFDAAVAAAMPETRIRDFLPARPAGRTVVVGAGKGAAQLAAALEAAWDGPLDGVVVTRYGYAVPCERIEVLEAAHPEPDAAGLAAGQRLLAAVADLGPDDLVIALIAGGGSALLPAPPPGLTLADEIAVNRALLASGAPIAEMNVVRKHVSHDQGRPPRPGRGPGAGGLADRLRHPRRHPGARRLRPDGARRQHARDGPRHRRARYGLDLPAAVLAHLASAESAAPDPADPAFARNEVHVIASAAVSLEAAQARGARRRVSTR